jgi:hypothetical protein
MSYNFQVFDNVMVPKVVRDTSHLRGGGRKSMYPFEAINAPGKAAFIPLAETKGLKAVQSAANAHAKTHGRYFYVRLIDQTTAAKDEVTAQILQAFNGVPQIGIFYRDPSTVKPRKPRTPRNQS